MFGPNACFFSGIKKIFDAFVVVARHQRLIVGFDCEVSNGVRDDLDDLLSELNYFGRSESWIKAKVLESPEWTKDPIPPSAAIESEIVERSSPLTVTFETTAMQRTSLLRTLDELFLSKYRLPIVEQRSIIVNHSHVYHCRS